MTKPGVTAASPFLLARKQPKRVEHYWLCDACAPQWTLIYDRDSGIVLAPLRRRAMSTDVAASVSS